MTDKNAINIYKNKALVNFEGKNFLGQIGVDSRIFHALNGGGISVGVISQQAIENGISVLVDEVDAEDAVKFLKKEFMLYFLTERHNIFKFFRLTCFCGWYKFRHLFYCI